MKLMDAVRRAGRFVESVLVYQPPKPVQNTTRVNELEAELRKLKAQPAPFKGWRMLGRRAPAQRLKLGFMGQVALWAAGFVPPETRTRLAEGIAGGTLMGTDIGGASSDPDFVGYRPLGLRMEAIRRDLDRTTQGEVIKQSLYLIASNPLARWLVDKTVSLTVGEGLTFTVTLDPSKFGKTGVDGKPVLDAKRQLSELAGPLPKVDATAKEKDPEDAKREALRAEIHAHLTKFWEHPGMDLHRRASEMAKTLLAGGALLLPVKFATGVKPGAALPDGVGEFGADGVPMLDLIDAAQITRVDGDGESAVIPGTVFYAGKESGRSTPLDIIRQKAGEDVLSGKAFYFPLTYLLNSMSGVPFLLHVIDWLDKFDQNLFAALDRARLGNSFVWKVVMQGASPAECAAFGDKLERDGKLAVPGAVLVTNERGGLEAVAPNLNAADVEIISRLILRHVLGAFDFPESWFGSGSETNRATAGDQSEITLKTLEAWQQRFRGVFEFMLRYAYETGRAANGMRTAAWPDWSTGAVTITVNMPPLSERNFGMVGDALGKLEAALDAAVTAEMLSRETARKVFLTVCSELGVEISEQEEVARIDAESTERKTKAAEELHMRVSAAAAAVEGGAPPKLPPGAGGGGPPFGGKPPAQAGA